MQHTILIVDDTEFMRFVLRDLLEDHGVGVIAEAGTRDEALDLCDALEPDLAVVDATGEEYDAVALVRALQAREEAPRVIAVAGIDDLEAARDLREAGAWDVLVKPFDPDAVDEALRAALPQPETV